MATPSASASNTWSPPSPTPSPPGGPAPACRPRPTAPAWTPPTGPCAAATSPPTSNAGLYNGGRGTRVEIDPVDQSKVHPKHRRALNTRHLTVRPHHWDTAVDAWLDDNHHALNDLWDNEITPGLGTDYDAYSYVSSVGWVA